MRKFFFYFLILGFFIYPIFATRITGVRIQPQKNLYSVGERIKVFWNYAQNSPSDKVRITIRKAGAEKALCILADFVDITKGGAGKSVVLNSPCRDAAGQNNEITNQEIWIRVQLKGQARTVYADSSHFTVKRFSAGDFKSIKLPSKEEQIESIRKMVKANVVIIKDFRLVAKNKTKGIYLLLWKFIGNNTPMRRPFIKLYRNGRYFCTVRRENPALGNTLFFFMTPYPLCRDHKPLPNDPVPTYQFMFDYSEYNMPPIFSQKMKLPLFPELTITKITISEGTTNPFFALFITVFNSGSAEAGPFVLHVSGKDCNNKRFSKKVTINRKSPPGFTMSYIINVPKSSHFNIWCCEILAFIESMGDIETTNGYTRKKPYLYKRFTPPHIRGHM